MREYLVHFAWAAAVCAVPFLVFAWWAEPLHGDLTRVGKWSERDFGPSALHPVISIAQNDPADRRATVLVLGDSFSVKNLWQSAAGRELGVAIRSYDYEATGCFDDWLDAAIADAASTAIVVESVERSLVARFARLNGCRHRDAIANRVAAGQTVPLRPGWPPSLSLSYLLPTAFHQLEARHVDERVWRTAKSVNAPLRQGCALFSHRRADRLLYLRDDDDKLQWVVADMQAVAANIRRAQDRVQAAGKIFVFAVAPDKSTVYSACLPVPDTKQGVLSLWPLLVAAGVNTPDLHGAFRAGAARIVDLYNPNDTHWSEAGHLLAGHEIAALLLRSPTPLRNQTETKK